MKPLLNNIKKVIGVLLMRIQNVLASLGLLFIILIMHCVIASKDLFTIDNVENIIHTYDITPVTGYFLLMLIFIFLASCAFQAITFIYDIVLIFNRNNKIHSD